MPFRSISVQLPQSLYEDLDRLYRELRGHYRNRNDFYLDLVRLGYEQLKREAPREHTRSIEPPIHPLLFTMALRNPRLAEALRGDTG